MSEKAKQHNSDFVISVYTDKQAVEDGVLVALTEKDRASRAVFDYLTEKTPDGPQSPACWPVEMMGWFQAKDALGRALALARGLVGAYGEKARTVYEKNIGGGILALWAVEHPDTGKLGKLQQAEPEHCAGRKLWLLPNELGGLTLMFPEDY